MVYAEHRSHLLQSIRLVLGLAAVTLVGTLGFHFIEGWDLFDSLYMAVITLSTVGYQEVHPLSTPGRVFVLVYLLAGLGVTLYLLAQLGELIIKAKAFEWWGQRRKTHMIQKLANHFIVCGYGRMGRTLCQALRSSGIEVVAIEAAHEHLDRAEIARLGIHLIIGDATDDETLYKAHIESARGIATVIGSDADNLFVVLSARLLAPHIKIISRAAEDNTIDKLRKAGADRVVSPYTAGANKMAQFLTHPGLSEIFDWEGRDGDGMEMAEIKVDEASPYLAQTVGKTDFRQQGVFVVAIRRPDGSIEFPPGPATKLLVGDRLIALGRKQDMARVLS